VSVVRPCLVGQLRACGAMLRNRRTRGRPGRALTSLPVVPVDERFGIQLLHAEDVADAVVRILERGGVGGFNIASEPVLDGHHVATALHGKPIHVRQELSRALVAAAWHAHVSPLDPGWVDMALQSAWADTSRARQLLGWCPRHSAEGGAGRAGPRRGVELRLADECTATPQGQSTAYSVP
jgi:UDP-glucose 4-epimerase